jgi:hypothetical protein
MFKAIKETEKAVQVKVLIDLYDIEKVIHRTAWIPKSQIRDGRPTAWILARKREDLELEAPLNAGGFSIDFFDADGNMIESVEDARSAERFEAGRKNYDHLIQLAKDNGIKGVRVGLRRVTIEQKLTAAGVAF